MGRVKGASAREDGQALNRPPVILSSFAGDIAQGGIPALPLPSCSSPVKGRWESFLVSGAMYDMSSACRQLCSLWEGRAEDG